MWKVWIREYDKNGKVLFEATLTKEYKTKLNAAKLAKKFREAHKNLEVLVGLDNPFEE